MDSSQQAQLDKVNRELARYEHPLFEWEALAVSRGIQVVVRVKVPECDIEPYSFVLTPRELEARAFQWDFQRLMYNYLHDYLVEMFTRSPQIADLSLE
jgi:hypothetical protein